ncbi:MAG TPA: trypsin-like peptidase domain-containing protein [Gemmatimonadales bacterium]|nr:trypsin-like peptidase domain-containing protein [Gemmatimonadales bacterium]
MRRCERAEGTGVRRAALLALLALGACQRADAPAEIRETVTSREGASQAGVPRSRGSVDASRRTAVVSAVEAVSPAVVSINATSRQRITPRTAWDAFFVPQGVERVVQGYGTGLIARPDGVIITNQHVVGGAERLVVTLPDGRDFPGRVLGEDPITDIAVVKIDAGDLPVGRIGRSTDLMTGEWVVALGNPFAYMLGNDEPTVTVGVVSATGRNILPSGEQAGLYLDMIQTDAAINPGNSGGPLVNALGEVVGINSSIFSSSGGSIGVGFAIPIERAIRVADEIVRSGTVRRAWTGLEVAGPRNMADWKSAGGVTVTLVAPGGPAERAGIEAGDVVTEASGRRLRNYLDWEAVKLDLHVGDAVELGVRDGDRVVRRRIVTGDLPTVSAEKVTILRDLELVSVTAAIQAERNLRAADGALIYRLSPEVSRATGLRAGDVIIGVNRIRIREAAQLAELLRGIEPRQPFRLTFERDGVYHFVDLTF